MREITKTEKQRAKTEYIWLIFVFLTVAVYFFGLNIPLVGPDEPRYAQIGREMFQRNDWVTPTLGGANWFEKPSLLYWLQIVSYRVFGVSEFAARFGSAVFGLGTIFCLWLLGKFFSADSQSYEENQKKKSKFKDQNSEFSRWLVLIAASSVGLIAFSHGASFDIVLTFPLTASLVGFFIFDQSRNKSFIAYILPLIAFYFFIGLALLAKGLIGIVFPFAIVAFYFVLSRKMPEKTFVFSLFWGTILSLLVASVWYVPMYLRHGWTFIDDFFVQHHFARYTSNKYQHPQPFYFFFWVLPLMMIPWLPFFLMAIWDLVKKLFHGTNAETGRENEKLGDQRSALSAFALSWLLVPLVFFSFSGSKLPGYILPALPAALILTAEYICRLVRNSEKRRIVFQALAFLTLTIVAILLQFVVPKFADEDSTKGLMETATAQGYINEKVFNLHTISHNAEFYAAGRLIRDEGGKLKKFFGVSEIADEISRQGGKDVLVLVPLEYLHELPESPMIESQILDKKGELAIVLVKGKQ